MSAITADFDTSDAGQSLATHLKYLGTGDAGTTMGAVEYLATEVRDGMQSISAEIRGAIEFVQAVKTSEEYES